MDMPSSATQRSSTDLLSVQPGAVRPSVANAASEFARHLAQNSQSNVRHDKPVERRDSSPAQDRPSHADKTRKEATSKEDAERTEKEKVKTTLADQSLASETFIADALVSETAEETDTAPLTLPIEAADTENADAASPVAIDGATPTTQTEAQPVLAEDDVAISVELVADTDAALPDQATTTDSNIPAEETAVPAGLAATTAATNNATPDAATDQPTAAPRIARQDAASPANITADGAMMDGDTLEITASTDEVLAQTGKPRAKGLGHAAAEQLADSKSEVKQASTQINTASPAALLAAARQSAPGNTQPTIGQPSGSVDQISARAGDMLATTAQPAATAAAGRGITLRIGVLPGQTQPSQIPASAIALQMTRHLQKGVNQFSIRLDPPEMGRIDIRMEVRKDGHVTAHMTVDRPETLDLLQRDARSLQQALTNAGLETESDSLNFSLRDQNGGDEQAGFGGNSSAPHGDDGAEETIIAPIYNVNLSATGGVDIRI